MASMIAPDSARSSWIKSGAMYAQPLCRPQSSDVTHGSGVTSIGTDMCAAFASLICGLQ